VVDALAYHWLSLPENYALRLHAARATVDMIRTSRGSTIRAARADLARAEVQIATAQAEIAAALAFTVIGLNEEAAA
jgi:hypothetical protein